MAVYYQPLVKCVHDQPKSSQLFGLCWQHNILLLQGLESDDDDDKEKAAGKAESAKE